MNTRSLRGTPGRRSSDPVRTLNLGSLLEDALCAPAARFDDRIVGWALEVEHDLMTQAEPSAWGQLVMSLVADSVQHGFADRPGGGSISVSAERLGTDRLRVVYRDDGRARCAGAAGESGPHAAREIVRERLRGRFAVLASEQGAAFEIDVPA
jgi:LytS/YehU family sensor histidine kinase